jgi:hypothetical protein
MLAFATLVCLPLGHAATIDLDRHFKVVVDLLAATV